MAEVGARSGYLTIDAMVGLTITTLAVGAAVSLASLAVTRMAQARDRLTAARIASEIYEDLYAGRRPKGRGAGATEGRPWSYVIGSADTPENPSVARHGFITVDRRMREDLVLEIYLPPEPAIRSSN